MERVDWKGVEIKIGSRVTDTDDRPGTVNHLGDWDGEVVDGRTVGYPPRICVEWEDGSESYYVTEPVWYMASHPRFAVTHEIDRLVCDDLEVVK